MDWKAIKEAGQTFGWWAVGIVAVLYIVHKGWLSLGREVSDREKLLEHEREQHEKRIAEKDRIIADKDRRIDGLEAENRSLMLVAVTNNGQVSELVTYLKTARTSRQDQA